jgi:hypothetical protein
MREYYLKSAQKENMLSPTESDNSSCLSDYGQYYENNSKRKVRVIDRFGMIIQIFAARAKS